MTSEKVACLVPARGGSRRFPRKNVALLHGRPLLAWAVDAARASGLFSDVWVSTEDDAIAAVATACGARVHPRPAALAGDEATIVQVAVDFASWLTEHGERGDALGIVLPTAVLLRAGDLRAAWARFAAGNADVVMAVTRYLESPFQALEEVDGHLRLFFGDGQAVQKATPVVVDSGAFYLARVAALREERTLYVRRLAGHPIPRERSIDIDEPAHLAIAEALMAAASRAARVGLRLEEARADQAPVVWEWANDPDVRASSFSAAPIPWDEHSRWWDAKLGDPAVRMWLLYDGSRPVGSIRYEQRDGRCAEVSLMVAPGERGRGLGTSLLTLSAPSARRALGVAELFGFVKKDNAASIRAFWRAGYTASDAGVVRGAPCLRFVLAADAEPIA